MRATPFGQHAGRNQNDQFVSKPPAPETSSPKCRRCNPACEAPKNGFPVLTTDPGNRGSKSGGNQGSISAKSTPKQNWTFEQVSDVAVKLTDGRRSLVPSSHGQWRGYETTLALGWLLCMGSVFWVVRIGDRRSPPMKLPAAKAYALEMLKGSATASSSPTPFGSSTSSPLR